MSDSPDSENNDVRMPRYTMFGLTLYRQTSSGALTRYKLARDTAGGWYWKEEAKIRIVPETKLAEAVATAEWTRRAPKAYNAQRDYHLAKDRLN